MSCLWVPDRADSEAVDAVATPVAMEAHPEPVEIADVDPVAIRAHILATDEDTLIQALARGQEQHDGGEHHVACPRILFALRDQPVLLLIGLGGGLIDRLLAQEEPAHFDRNIRERLLLVPNVAEQTVEQLRGVALHILALPDVVDGHREARDEHMGVGAGLERRFIERNGRELLTLVGRVLHAERFLDLFESEEVGAHNNTGPRMIIFDQRGQFRLGLVVQPCEHHCRALIEPVLVFETLELREHLDGDTARRQFRTMSLERLIRVKHL